MKLLKHKLLIFALSITVITGLAAPVVATQSVYAQPETSDVKPKKDDCKPPDGESLSQDNCGIIKMIVILTRIVSGIAGLVIIGTMVFGGIQYSAAGSDPSKVQAAKSKITNALLALFLLIFGFAIIQWLTPGGF